VPAASGKTAKAPEPAREAPVDSNELDAQRAAYREGFPFHREDDLMLNWYAGRVVRALASRRARSVVSLGIGQQIIAPRIFRDALPALDGYYIVEGSGEAIEEFRHGINVQPRVRLEHALFERYEPPAPVDAVEMGFILEHVEDPAFVLRRYAGFLKPGGVALVAVPNARSLHRLVGEAAGLLDDVYRLSPEDLQYGHRRYFDLDSLTKTLVGAGYRVEVAEGIFLKPVTTRQFEALALAPEVVDAFFRVGVDYPAIANAIYVEATV
jgi:SAM-dependent methyltransferase